MVKKEVEMVPGTIVERVLLYHHLSKWKLIEVIAAQIGQPNSKAPCVVVLMIFLHKNFLGTFKLL